MFVSNVGGIIAAASKESAHPLRKTGKIPAIKRIVLSMQQAGLFPIVVVVGADDYESRYQLNNLNVVFLILEESDEKRELFHSVKAGLSYLQDKCLSVVFTPVNAPMFIPKTIVEMRKHHDDIVVPSYKKKAGYDAYINSLPDDYTALKTAWNKLSSESDKLYKHFESGVLQTGNDTDTAIFVQYREAFSKCVSEKK